MHLLEDIVIILHIKEANISDLLFKNDLVTYSVSSKLDRHLEGKFLADFKPHCEISKDKQDQIPNPEFTTYSSILKWLSDDLGLPKLNVEVSRAIKQLKVSQNN
ncbi:hypothetical protein DSO57_1032175 [Entomophthora muscae]|uniref:Uncharacterized protein n=1 Tax=Entomophthora muscae TaxID=34485 RepID=A0ACC2TBI7_9FUNG|nr:hypothetical protein DSO57_1032175 [Entomophthora muscae]